MGGMTMKKALGISSPQTTAAVAIAIAALLVGFAPRAFGADTTPCEGQPERRALDFWLGDWKIGVPNENVNAVSKVSLELGDCVVVERWNGGDGHVGENIFGYSADDKSWHGMFADSVGHVHVFLDGQVRLDSAEFSGTSRGEHGETILNRITIRRVDRDHVRQVWAKSSDGGNTWTTVFNGDYTRKS
jgi:putative sterol carrier protein